MTTTNATLTGMGTPRGLPTVAWFEWGTNGNYGQATGPVSLGSGTKVVWLSSSVGPLLPDLVYRCRLVASNSAGITFGSEKRFTTGRRVATWGDSIFGPPWEVLPPTNLGNVVSIAAGDYHGLALKADGSVVTWGRYSVVGAPFLPPASLSNVIAIAGGRDHNLALQTNGNLVAWGDNSSGQTNVPAGLSNVVAISAGDAHCLVLKSDGSLAGWGKFGSGNFSGFSLPPRGLSNVVAISSGDSHCVALQNNGTVTDWGDFLQAPSGLSNVVAIAAGYLHSLALKMDGTVVSWGFTGGLVPAGLSNVVAIAASDYTSLALRSDGTMAAWRLTGYGPTTLPNSLSDVVDIVCGDEYCMALASNTPPQPTPRTFTGPVNQDSILSLNTLARDPNNDPLTWRILSAPTSGALYQYQSNGRGNVITETNTTVSDALARVIFAPEPDEFGAPYAGFDVAASDGEFDSAASVATVNIVPAPTLAIAAPSQSFNGAVPLYFAGLSNATYSVWASTNLINWARVGSPSQTSPEQFLYTDTSITNLPRRFFRLTSP